MGTRSIATIAVMLAVAPVGFACMHEGKASRGAPALESSSTLQLAPRRSPLTKVEERFKDSEGNELVLTVSEGSVEAKAFDKNRNPLKVKKIKLEDAALLCLDAEKTKCMPLTYVSDGTVLKFYKESCNCTTYSGWGYCTGWSCW